MEIKTKKTVLIVDDEPMICMLLRDFLEMEGYTVYEAGDGNMGLRVFKELKPDIVIIDVKMPGIDGVKLKKLIKEADSNVEIITMSGHIEAIDRYTGDGDIFLKKPFNLKELADVLRALEDKKRSPRGDR